MTTTVIARGAAWSDSFCNAGLGGFRCSYSVPAAGERAALWVRNRFEELCAKAGFADVHWMSATSEVWGDVNVDHDKLDLDALRDRAYEECAVEDAGGIDDIDPDELVWDGERFIWPSWLEKSLHAQAVEQYALLAEYNISYDVEVCDINDLGYLLYKTLRELIDRGSTILRLKNGGPYNPQKLKIVLVRAVQITGAWYEGRTDGQWTQIKLSECEDTYEILKLVGVQYPWQWKSLREARINREADVFKDHAAPELAGLLEAHRTVVGKIAELERERDRLSKRIATEQPKYDGAVQYARGWVAKMLAR